ncbi:MAG: 6,7-dimethyl-8-ribityllumazine synthase [Fibromonadaceae bacterium]|jgi:6,7-dimethyl-8-ribityllumazine synthase|nr:6,7-dimethyl-8-ribityllumazine synthase [Fibromonadaceae bacterium]
MNVLEGCLDGRGLKIAIAISRFNETITKSLLDGAITQLKRTAVSESDITVAWVPGAFELPGVAARFAGSGEYNAVIVLGAVIRGATPHFDHVSNAVNSGIARLASEGKIPVIFGVLTTDTVEQAMDRAGLKCGNKGTDAALAAIEMANLHKRML